MAGNSFQLTMDSSAGSIDRWQHHCESLFGLTCKFDPVAHKQDFSAVRGWSLGESQLIDARLAHHSSSPICSDTDPSLFVKLVVSGEMHLEQDGSMRRLGRGSLVLLDAATPYYQTFGSATHLIALRFSRQFMTDRGFGGDLFRRFIVPDPSKPDVQAISSMVASIADQGGNTSDALRRRQGAQLVDILDLLFDHPAGRPRARSSEATLFRAKRFIAQNLCNSELSVPLIAKSVFVSDAHLSKLFRGDGESPMRYLWRRRLELAAELLERGLASHTRISEIALRCGFSNAGHFSRAFKQRYGMTPRQAVCGLPTRHVDAFTDDKINVQASL